MTIKVDTAKAQRALLEAGFSASTVETGAGEFTHTFNTPPNPLLKNVEYTPANLRWRRDGEDLEVEAEFQRTRDLFALSAHGYPADVAEKALAAAEKYGIPVAMLHKMAQERTTGGGLGNLGYVATTAAREVATALPAPATIGRGRGESKARRRMAKASRRRNRR